jgi:hypothetical protein
LARRFDKQEFNYYCRIIIIIIIIIINNNIVIIIIIITVYKASIQRSLFSEYVDTNVAITYITQILTTHSTIRR